MLLPIERAAAAGPAALDLGALVSTIRILCFYGKIREGAMPPLIELGGE